MSITDFTKKGRNLQESAPPASRTHTILNATHYALADYTTYVFVIRQQLTQLALLAAVPPG